MTAHHDLERRIADFYETEAPRRAPDRVLEQALATIESTPQRRVLVRAPWRFRPLNANMKLAIAAVAIVALTALAVSRLLPSGVGIEPTPTPATPSEGPTSTPVPTPTPTLEPAVVLPDGGASLAIGRYAIAIQDSPVSIELTVNEAGWQGNGWYVGDGGSRSISFWAVANVYEDACDLSSLPEPPIGPTVDDLVNALDAQVGTDMTRFFNPVVDGYGSTRVVMRPTPGVEATCARGVLQMWHGATNDGRGIETAPAPEGQEDVLWILDVEGHRVVIDGYYDESGVGASGDAILAMIDSITFVVP